MSHSHVTREERVVITYLNMMNVSQAEIAQRIGKSSKAAESILTRAREAFRDSFRSLIHEEQRDLQGGQCLSSVIE